MIGEKKVAFFWRIFLKFLFLFLMIFFFKTGNFVTEYLMMKMFFSQNGEKFPPKKITGCDIGNHEHKEI
jgi:hypothetical protein